jgi:biofilm PGA synthesis N-glycosyltransferase PgaC
MDLPVSVIIPAWNEENTIQETMQALMDMDYDKRRCEVIVVAGGRDATYDLAKSLTSEMHPFERYIVIKQEPNGKNAAIQAGIDMARNGVIVLLDADTRVSSPCLRLLISALEKEGADMVFANPEPVRTSWVSQYYSITKAYTLDEISYYSGHALAFKKKIVDGRFHHFFDTTVKVGVDYFLAKKFMQEGRKVFFARDAVVKTHIPWSFPFFFRSELRWLTARVGIDGVKMADLVRHMVLVLAIVFASPFFGAISVIAWMVHTAYIFKQYHVFRSGNENREKPIMGFKGFMGFIFLSYTYHFIGTLAYARHFLGMSHQRVLSQGQR